MVFLICGIVLLVMKLADLGPAAAWSWWLILAPFGLATLWWGFADAAGLTQRRAMAKMEQKKADRRNRNLEALGLGPRRERKAGNARVGAAAVPDAPRRPAADPAAPAPGASRH